MLGEGVVGVWASVGVGSGDRPQSSASMGVVGMPGLDHLLGTEAEEGRCAGGGGGGGLG